MIECRVELGDGSVLTLPTAVRWEFGYGTGLPCDSFFLRCLWEQGQERALSSAALFYADWQGERVFTGVVDEYGCICGGDGLYLELSGRGMAARLLDNEALPARYQRAAWADVAARHVTPYGVTAVGGERLAPVSGFSVDSGTSEWSVVQQFCQYYNGVVPRFDREGRLVLSPHEESRVLVVGDGTPVTGWEYREQRHGVLSAVAVRRRTDWDIQWAVDQKFIAEGGCARRVVTVPDTTGDGAMRYTGEYQLRASRRERICLTLTLPEGFSAWPGDAVRVERTGFGANGLYRVARCEVSCGGDGLYTTLTLCAWDSMI